MNETLVAEVYKLHGGATVSMPADSSVQVLRLVMDAGEKNEVLALRL